MPYDEVIAALADYGNVVEGSIRRGKVKQTNIENGTRYLALVDAKKIIPGTLIIGEFDVRVFCDNNRTECKHCGLTSHRHYKCPVRTVKEKRCYRCFSTSHMVQECTNDVACRYCCQTGHVERNCEDHKELTDRKKYW